MNRSVFFSLSLEESFATLVACHWHIQDKFLYYKNDTISNEGSYYDVQYHQTCPYSKRQCFPDVFTNHAKEEKEITTWFSIHN